MKYQIEEREDGEFYKREYTAYRIRLSILGYTLWRERITGGPYSTIKGAMARCSYDSQERKHKRVRNALNAAIVFFLVCFGIFMYNGFLVYSYLGDSTGQVNPWAGFILSGLSLVLSIYLVTRADRRWFQVNANEG